MDPVGGRSKVGPRRLPPGEAGETPARLYRARLLRGPLGDDLPGAVGLAAGDAVAGLELVADGDLVLEFAAVARSEEHTSELQSLMRTSYAVFCLKKKNKTQ